MNNEELVHNLSLIKNAIDVLREELAPDLKSRDLMLLRYGFSNDETEQLDKYLLNLTLNKEKITYRQLKAKMCEIRDLPEIPMKTVKDIYEGYRASKVIGNIIKTNSK
ncbi:hypothetical protein ACUW9N_001331 [Staphylococcus auricularis]|uniref:Uncharacterized protein n=1 Tax=Staphylococcus auricularis TaxID=29379 RepID=A0AAP8PPL8_9STAP|nr:hypothetical protein [Staphylococcus auricularis]MBM0868251.1 hypothetical protein [Staphylococcus auricularis]MCG7340735.1 hypothetical protein [Staphylococcus auricularis]MDC6327239.1 hypothetical protein [Staphylococcus auricularis]MDN4533051.1 hypothetical protein [Staphylococcus auricularis]MDN4533447.1 hypothetical protein [Staphylococcus auricularis]